MSLPPGSPVPSVGETRLRWRSLTTADLPALDQLISLIEAADQPRERHSRDGLLEWLQLVGAEPRRDTVIGQDDDGTLVAYGWNFPQHDDISLRRVKLMGGVHPAWRGQGIGHALLAWQQDAARAWYRQTRTPEHGPLRILVRVDDQLSAQRRLYEALGLPTTRWFTDLGWGFDGEPEAPEPVFGVEIVPLMPGLAEGARLAYNSAFDGQWNAQPMTATHWAEVLGASTARSDWCLAAVTTASAEVVAAPSTARTRRSGRPRAIAKARSTGSPFGRSGANAASPRRCCGPRRASSGPRASRRPASPSTPPIRPAHWACIDRWASRSAAAS
jgi:mycothiol synthase